MESRASDGFAAGAGYFSDNFVRVRLTGGVIDDDRRAFVGELFGDACADAFGRTGDNGDFAGEFLCKVCAHVSFGLFAECLSGCRWF